MPGTPRKPRTNPGPGRQQQQQRRRPRAGARPAAPKAKPAIPVPRWQRRLKLTRRALALGVVVLALAVSFISTFQIYVRQQHEMAVADQQIRDSTAQIATLETELARWNDPAYVRAQARERLGWRCLARPDSAGRRQRQPDRRRRHPGLRPASGCRRGRSDLVAAAERVVGHCGFTCPQDLRSMNCYRRMRECGRA